METPLHPNDSFRIIEKEIDEGEFDSAEHAARTKESWRLMQVVQYGRREEASVEDFEAAAEAFGQLYEMYHDPVYRMICMRVQNTTLAQDLTSDVFARALKASVNVQWQGKELGAWLNTIGMNRIRDHFKSKYVQSVDLDGEAGMFREDTSRSANTEHVAIERAYRADILEAIRQLTEDQQQAIVLRYLEERSIGETARIMGREIGAVKALTFRATSALRRILKPDVEPNDTPELKESSDKTTVKYKQKAPKPPENTPSLLPNAVPDNIAVRGMVRVGADFFKYDAPGSIKPLKSEPDDLYWGV